MTQRIPLIVLAGSDLIPGPVPRGLRSEEMLTGYKGALRLPSGRSLAAELIERYRASGRFSDPILVGPREVYQHNVDCEIVDVSGNLATTLERVRQLLLQRFPLTEPVGFSTCDILPSPAEISQLLETGYDPVSETQFWGELVAARPDQLGASAWKPDYRMRPDEGLPLTSLYPGHLVVARPAALRMRLTNHLLQLAYRHRNRNIRARRWRLLASGLGRLMYEDFRNLFALQLPVLSISIPYYCMRGYRRLQRGGLTLAEFADDVAKVFLHRNYLGNSRCPPVVFCVTSILSLAKDIDTKAEFSEACRQSSPADAN